jgi:membrane associated rhomboid family serine protease
MEAMESSHFEAPAPGGQRPQYPGQPDYAPAPEPMLNAPWPVVVLTLGLVAAYAVQSQFPFILVQHAFAFSPALLHQGHVERLVSSVLVHGSWAHALFNAAFGLAFGAPVSRYLGPRFGGAVAFFLFFFLCGVVACLGFAALHWGQQAAMVGASGAVSGMMGGAARLIGGGGDGRPGPLFSKAVTSMGGAWVVINLIMAVAPGVLIPGVGPNASVGWEAHIVGFVAGVLLIGPVGWLAGRR